MQTVVPHRAWAIAVRSSRFSTRGLACCRLKRYAKRKFKKSVRKNASYSSAANPDHLTRPTTSAVSGSVSPPNIASSLSPRPSGKHALGSLFPQREPGDWPWSLWGPPRPRLSGPASSRRLQLSRKWSNPGQFRPALPTHSAASFWPTPSNSLAAFRQRACSKQRRLLARTAAAAVPGASWLFLSASTELKYNIFNEYQQ